MLYQYKDDIIAWLNRYDVKNYILKPDENYGYVVNVAGDVSLSDKRLNEIPVKFGFISRDFYCSRNQLTSLQNSPHSVAGNFLCQSNQLTSLKGMPQEVGELFSCQNNPHLGILQDITDIKVIKSYLFAQNLEKQLSKNSGIKHIKKIKL